ncbi:hypothetical protein CC77DRAFT_272934 [Alternaria alternata]|uniref:Uncharacterized protein n=1 Tax=Alternaria alternata TaxID=5599 RepID=A0A177DBP5_ALTAL|nr:hypothetical protein CC77DRAFT_272934 [Alternaria alternata]OAG17095.1 hypothetical protein CC77DRAFT_272934 [Alternaria alternata]
MSIHMSSHCAGTCLLSSLVDSLSKHSITTHTRQTYDFHTSIARPSLLSFPTLPSLLKLMTPRHYPPLSRYTHVLGNRSYFRY